jgi:dipeptidyl aminopeptidase/acylaminoacyl peptidase
MSICTISFKAKLYLFIVIPCFFFHACTSGVTNSKPANRAAVIDPDYSDCVIPVNIAPLNFLIQEPGVYYHIEIYGETEKVPIIIDQKDQIVQIPMKQWRRLLQKNRGGTLVIAISVKDSSGQWLTYPPIKNRIAMEDIDSYVVYRLINPGYVLWWDMGIYQRCVENFEQTAIFTNKLTRMNCMNCHSFCNNNPDMMMFHMRGAYGGTMLIQNGAIEKINTATNYTMSAGVYPAWHPSGKYIAFSVNKISQRFHTRSSNSIYVNDKASDLILYDIQKNMVTTSPKVSTGRLENLPNWSPDGRYLYFCASPGNPDARNYTQVKYDLNRIACDVVANQWGEVETLLSAEAIGKSISFPKVSPDGKYLLFCMSDYGYFTVHFKSSDLYLMDLASSSYSRLPVNSDYPDSYHSWSSNSRWFVFVSKRRDGVFSRLYISYLDSGGNAAKPFLLPQADPTFYDQFIMNYNVPELVTGRINANAYDLARIAYEDAQEVRFDPEVNIDALSGATRIKRNN